MPARATLADNDASPFRNAPRSNQRRPLKKSLFPIKGFSVCFFYNLLNLSGRRAARHAFPPFFLPDIYRKYYYSSHGMAVAHPLCQKASHIVSWTGQPRIRVMLFDLT
jgi:hypothetical protein